ncbi:lactonase family protein [Acidovorax sp. JMULE5]|uniref:lactonase family protein n=1 Tax=Acidovorax sp. JMULE5 TaxID=2518343 RepID=UPI0015A003EA|nr:lactonase family protein [Acidovorax sp. JMULE5]QLA81182.1 lactonase family protein [Acidovorax sp. JMULE5]
MATDTLVFVSCADSGELHVLRLASDSGQLCTEQVLALGGQLMPMALSPDGTRLYVARRSDPLAVVTLAVDARAGCAEVLSEAALPASMAHLATDNTGRWLLSASYGADLVAVQAIAADGVVAAGRGATTYATSRHAHSALVSPGNRFVLAASLGGGQLHRYRFDAATGALQPTDPAVFALPAGTGPRHLRFNARGDRIYLLGELDACVHVLAWDESSGGLELLQSLPTLPPGFAGPAWGADLHLSADGRWLYTSERNSHTLAGFAVDAVTGLLAPIDHWSTQLQPRGFAITPDGCHLIAAGQISHRVGVHLIAPGSGALTQVAEHDVGLNPNWITVLPMQPDA